MPITSQLSCAGPTGVETVPVHVPPTKETGFTCARGAVAVAATLMSTAVMTPARDLRVRGEIMERRGICV